MIQKDPKLTQTPDRDHIQWKSSTNCIIQHHDCDNEYG